MGRYQQMATTAQATTPRANPPVGVGISANGIPYPVYAPGTEDRYCTGHQSCHPNGDRCLPEPASLKDTPPASVRLEQDNDHPGFAPPAANADTGHNIAAAHTGHHSRRPPTANQRQPNRHTLPKRKIIRGASQT